MVVKQTNEVKPQFEGQYDDEIVEMVFRRHIIAMRRGFYEILIPLVVTSIPPLIWQDNLKLFLLPLAGLVIGLMLFLYRLMQWRFTIYIVTNKRIRQVTQRGFFGRDVVEVRLSKIQNISYNIPGFWGEILSFGTIIIQTFVGDLVINNVAHTSSVYNDLQDVVYKYGNLDQETYEETRI